MKNIRLVFSFCAFLGLSDALAQNFVFSQYRALPYLINPATTGNLTDEATSRLALIARSHWVLPSPEVAGMQGAAVGWDRRFCGGNSHEFQWALGIFAQYDDTFDGGIRNTQARLMASASHTFIGDSWISAGGSIGGMEYGINPEKLTFNQQYNDLTGLFDKPTSASGEIFARESAIDWNATAGVRFSSQKIRRDNQRQPGAQTGWSVGFAIHNIPGRQYTFLPVGKDRTPNRLHAGYSILADGRWPDKYFALNAFFQRQSFSVSRQWQAVLGAAWIFSLDEDNFVDIGVQARIAGRASGLGSFTTGNAVIVTPEWRAGRGILRVSFDIGLSRLGNTPPNGIEISFVQFFGTGRCPMDCP